MVALLSPLPELSSAIPPRFTTQGEPHHVADTLRRELRNAFAELSADDVESIAAAAQAQHTHDSHTRLHVFVEVTQGTPPSPAEQTLTLDGDITASYTFYATAQEGHDKILLRELRRIQYLQNVIMPMLETTDRAGSMQSVQSAIRTSSTFINQIKGVMTQVEHLAQQIERAVKNPTQTLTAEQKNTAIQTLVQQIRGLQPTEAKHIPLKAMLMEHVKHLQQNIAPFAPQIETRHTAHTAPPSATPQSGMRHAPAATQPVTVPANTITRDMGMKAVGRASLAEPATQTVMKTAPSQQAVSQPIASSASIVAPTVMATPVVTPMAAQTPAAVAALSSTFTHPVSVSPIIAVPLTASVTIPNAQAMPIQITPIQTGQAAPTQIQNAPTQQVQPPANTNTSQQLVASVATAPIAAAPITVASVQPAVTINSTSVVNIPVTPAAPIMQTTSTQNGAERGITSQTITSQTATAKIPTAKTATETQPTVAEKAAAVAQQSPEKGLRPFDKVAENLGHPIGCACDVCKGTAGSRVDQQPISAADKLAKMLAAASKAESQTPPIVHSAPQENVRPFDKVAIDHGHPPGCACAVCKVTTGSRVDLTPISAADKLKRLAASKNPSLAPSLTG